MFPARASRKNSRNSHKREERGLGACSSNTIPLSDLENTPCTPLVICMQQPVDPEVHATRIPSPFVSRLCGHGPIDERSCLEERVHNGPIQRPLRPLYWHARGTCYCLSSDTTLHSCLPYACRKLLASSGCLHANGQPESWQIRYSQKIQAQHKIMQHFRFWSRLMGLQACNTNDLDLAEDHCKSLRRARSDVSFATHRPGLI